MKPIFILLCLLSFLEVKASVKYTARSIDTHSDIFVAKINMPYIETNGIVYNIKTFYGHQTVELEKNLNLICKKYGFEEAILNSSESTDVKNKMFKHSEIYDASVDKVIANNTYGQDTRLTIELALLKVHCKNPKGHLTATSNYKNGILTNYKVSEIKYESNALSSTLEVVFKNPFFTFKGRKFYFHPMTSRKLLCDLLGYHEVAGSKTKKLNQFALSSVLTAEKKLKYIIKSKKINNEFIANDIISEISCWDKKTTDELDQEIIDSIKSEENTNNNDNNTDNLDQF